MHTISIAARFGSFVSSRGRALLEHVRIVNRTADDRVDVERVVEKRAGPISVSPAFG